MNMDVRKLRVKNTKNGGLLEFLVYPEKGNYVGVCLTLDIVEEGKDPARLMESIQGAAFGHVLLVVKKNLGDDLLNRPAPDQYWEKYFAALDELSTKNKALKSRHPYTSQVPLQEAFANA